MFHRLRQAHSPTLRHPGPVLGWLSFLLALCPVPFNGLAAAPAIESIFVSGREYVRLKDLAQAKGLDLAWIKRMKTIQVKSPSHRIVVTVDSLEAYLDDIQVWLVLPVIKRNDRLYISRLDLQTTFQPLLLPQKSSPARKVTTICLDAGHGGKDPGNQVGAFKEKSFTLLLAAELRDQLERAGFTVTLTRTKDTFLDLETRPAIANRRKADLLLSLHFNASPSSRGTVRGSEVYALTPAGARSTNVRGDGGSMMPCPGNSLNDRNILLAYHLQKALVRTLGTQDRGVRRARFAVLRDATMPAALVEAGFMSHPAEGEKIFSQAYRRQIARAIVSGVLTYKKVVEQ